MRTKVLFVNEFSCHNSGYAKYGMEVIKRLAEKKDIRVAELACYGSEFNKKDRERADRLPWDVYFNTPDLKNPEHAKLYRAKKTYEWGEFKFNEVLLHFKPHVVCTIRDQWMDSFVEESAFRDMYNWCMMTTVDSTPQHTQWIYTFSQADGVFTYTDWGAEILRKQAGSHINLLGSTPACASDIYIPYNKNKAKAEFGIGENCKIVGTVMRNQSRKLFPDLMYSFRQFLDRSQRPDVFLYCHTAYPDSAWNIPELLKTYEIASRVLFTYKCTKCEHVFPNYYQGIGIACPKCQRLTAQLPRVENGVSEEELAKLMQCFDLYVQYANCLAKGQKIKTKNGWKNIEDVCVGEEVWTHKGRYKKVVNTFKKNINEKILKIKCHADYDELLITKEHPIYKLDNSDYSGSRSFREHVGMLVSNGKDLPKKVFAEARSLKVGDILAKKIDVEEKPVYELDMTDYIPEHYTIEDGRYKYKTAKIWHDVKIKTDNDLFKWFGLYVADGCASRKSSVYITSNTKDVENYKLCDIVMPKFGKLKHKPYTNRNAIDSTINNTVFKEYIEEHCKKDIDKKLPDWSITLPLSQQKCILQGLFMGDGSYSEKDNVSIYVTISPQLSKQIKELCERLGLNYNVNTVVKSGNRRIQYRFEIRGNISKGEFSTKRSSTRGLYHDGYKYVQIKEIEEVDYKGHVYTIEVEDDNSYTCDAYHVRNCEGQGLPQMEAALCGTPVVGIDYSGMADVLPKVGGEAIKPVSMRTEPLTGRLQANPDNEKFVQYLCDFFSTPLPNRSILGKRSSDMAKQNYNWDDTANKWYEYFKTVDLVKYEQAWQQPSRIRKPAKLTEQEYKMSNMDYAYWLITQVLCDPTKLHSYLHMRILRDLNNGMTLTYGNSGSYFSEDSMATQKPAIKPFDRKMAYNECLNICNEFNAWEKRR